jgi:hypothetical protein
MRFALLTLVCGLVTATTARAQYHMLLPDRHSVKAGRTQENTIPLKPAE